VEQRPTSGHLSGGIAHLACLTPTGRVPHAFKGVAVPTRVVRSHRHPSSVSRRAAGYTSPQCYSPLSLLQVTVNHIGVRLQRSSAKPPSTSSTMRCRHRCFVRRPDRLTPTHLPRKSSAVELSPSPAATAPPPTQAIADLAVFCRRPLGKCCRVAFFSEAGGRHPHPLRSP
jgi:hypothetical protein